MLLDPNNYSENGCTLMCNITTEEIEIEGPLFFRSTIRKQNGA